MDRDILLLLIGAGIALISSVVTTLINHWLSLRADLTKRARDREEKEIEDRRAALLHGVNESIKVAGDTISVSVGNSATDIAVGKNIAQEDNGNSLESISDEDFIVIQNLFQDLAQIIESRSSPEISSIAIERLTELEEAVLLDQPDLTTVQYVVNWFSINNPELAEMVKSTIDHPTVSKHIGAKGNS